LDASTARLTAAGTPSLPGIHLDGATKRFGRTAAVDGVSLEIAAGEFFVVLGPSGCGKSTLLRLVAGLETLDGGRIALGGEEVAAPGRHVAPEARSVAVVFQSYALWPHMSVAGNVAFPAESAGLSRAQVKGVVDGALQAVSLTEFAARRPAALSGGQQQRVALARCLASRARTVLMDEPLANLDPHLRNAMEAELARVHTASGATTLYITHDQREAMALADRIAVMRAGRFLQVADPVSLYERPASETVARFIGRSAIVDAHVLGVTGERALVAAAGLSLEADCPHGTREGPCRLVVRPHQVRIASEGPLSGHVADVAYRGGLFEVEIAGPGGVQLVAEVRGRPPSGPARFGIDGGWVLPQTSGGG
jgi:iron(III) transport system ATP-binding protein